MLKWLDIVKFTINSNPNAGKTAHNKKSDNILDLPQYLFSIDSINEGEGFSRFETCKFNSNKIYACVYCQTPLFYEDAILRAEMQWTSFAQPTTDNALAFYKESNEEKNRVNVTCKNCGAYLGLVFPNGPFPGGLRFYIRTIALATIDSNEKKCTLGGGCFWCTEAIFQQLKGIVNVESGYSGGKIANPTYREVCSGITGHAEVIEITYDPTQISFSDLIRIHLTTHNPTRSSVQEKEWGTQYRSIIFYRNQIEKTAALEVVQELQLAYKNPIVTEIVPFEHFYKAEERHQNYYINNPDASYCQNVINPKLKNLKSLYRKLLKYNPKNK
ncbi:peptide-methionine (S)-S-oxide reductase MsrA [Flavobacterium faecale]|uniref:peptide-methionine (S)-S-oxide reductase MsrA n=1 Tax=Flavobacterium faecale TaxID=1355330 RepID=UPI003AAEDBF8